MLEVVIFVMETFSLVKPSSVSNVTRESRLEKLATNYTTSPPAAGTPPAATDMAAAALTPYFSSRLFTRPEISNIVAWSIHSSTSLIVIAIFVQLLQSKPGSARILRAGRQLSARARWKRALPGNPQYNRGLIETFQFSLPHSFQIRNRKSAIRNPIFESVSKPGTGLAPAP